MTWKKVTQEEFFAVINPLNVHPYPEPDHSRWEMLDGSRRIIGKSTPGYKSRYGTPEEYFLAVYGGAQ